MSGAIERVAELIGCGRYRDVPLSHWDGSSAAPQGSATMTRILFGVTLSPALIAGWFCGNTANTSRNWGIRYAGGATVRLRLGDGGGSLRFASLSMEAARTVGALWGVGCSYDGTILMRSSAGETASAGPFVGFNASAVDTMSIGTTSGTPDTSESHGTVALLGSDTVALDQAGLAAALASVEQDLRQGRNPAVAAGYDEFLWQAKNIDWVNGEWTDDIAGITLSQVGNPERVSVPGRVL